MKPFAWIFEQSADDGPKGARVISAVAALLLMAGCVHSEPSGKVPLGEVRKCWNVGKLSGEALHTTVTIAVTMDRDGKPSNLRLISHEGGSDAAVVEAFEAGRQAIIRCASEGFDLPEDRYEQWKEIEITFDPSKMAVRGGAGHFSPMARQVTVAVDWTSRRNRQEERHETDEG